MKDVKISVVIATFNRVHLIGRAISSVNQHNPLGVEVIVVDDASTDTTEALIRQQFPNVKYMRQETNQGPGPARNQGIQAATNDLVLILDDDDTIVAGALETVARKISALHDWHKYPVFQFACSSGRAPGEFLEVEIGHYLNKMIQGEFAPIIYKPRFQELGLSYPDLRIGAEHLLWWDIAERFRLPTWALVIVDSHDDAEIRLTSFTAQIKNAKEHARAQELTLQKFGDQMQLYAPDLYFLKIAGVAVYWILAGDKRLGRAWITKSISHRLSLQSFVLYLLSFLPNQVFKRLYEMYRRAT